MDIEITTVEKETARVMFGNLRPLIVEGFSMKSSFLYITATVALSTFLSQSCFRPTQSREVATSVQTPSTAGDTSDVPQELENAVPDPAITKESSAVVTVKTGGALYLGDQRLPLDRLVDGVAEKLKGKYSEDQIVYLKAADDIDYGSVEDVLKSLAKQGIDQVGLVVKIRTSSHLSRFKILVTTRDTIKPSPRILLVRVTPDRKLSLNMFEIGDTNRLRIKLHEIYLERERVDGIGVEGFVLVKAQREARYGDFVRVVDAIAGSGSWQIALLVDDLP